MKKEFRRTEDNSWKEKSPFKKHLTEFLDDEGHLEGIHIFKTLDFGVDYEIQEPKTPLEILEEKEQAELEELLLEAFEQGSVKKVLRELYEAGKIDLAQYEAGKKAWDNELARRRMQRMRKRRREDAPQVGCETD